MFNSISVQAAEATASFCVTLVDFSPSQASDFEDAIRQIPNSPRFKIRAANHISEEAYPAAVVHAIVLTQ